MSLNQNENIVFWIQTFVNTYIQDSNDLELVKKHIFNEFNNNLPILFQICTKIMINNNDIDENIKIAKIVSSYFLFHMLNFKKSEELQKIQSFLTEEIAEQAKNAFSQNIFSENPIIRDKTIHCYALLFSILGPKWEEGVNNIVNSFNNINLIPYGTIVLLSVMTSIVKTHFFAQIFPSFSVQFTQTFVFCMHILSKELSEQTFIPELRNEASLFIANMIEIRPSILNNGINKGERIPSLLMCLSNSFQINNFDLFYSLHQILYNIVSKFYDISSNFIGKIAEFVENGLKMNSFPRLVNVSIFFWKRIAILESRLVACNQKAFSPLLTEKAIPYLMPILIYYIENIDENDIHVENPKENPIPSMYATTTISELINISPFEVFRILKDKIEEEFTKSSWTSIHAGIEMIYTITDQNKIDLSFREIINKHFEDLIKSIKPDKVPRLRETSIYVIGLIFHKYPEIFVNLKEKVEIYLNEIINSFEQTLNKCEMQQGDILYDDLLILHKFTYLFYYLFDALSDDNHQFIIEKYFDKFSDLLKNLMNFSKQIRNQKLFIQSNNTFDNLIIDSPKTISNKLYKIYLMILNSLIQTKNDWNEDEFYLLQQSSYCTNLLSIITFTLQNSLENYLIPTYGKATLDVLYHILSKKNIHVYANPLFTICCIIHESNSDKNCIQLFTPETFQILLCDYAYSGLISLNPKIIEAACSIINNLYMFYSQKNIELIQIIPHIFNMLCELLNNNELKSSYPSIFMAISSIFTHVNSESLALFDLEAPLYELLMKYIDFYKELDLIDKTDIRYGNEFYQYLTYAIRGYAHAFYNNKDPNIERKQLYMLDNLARNIYFLFPNINDNLYISFMKTAKQFAIDCTRRNNVLLNRHSIHRLLKNGKDMVQDFMLKREFSYTIEFLKSK